MPVTALPTPPSRSDPVNFPTRADNFLGALPTFALELNEVQSAVSNSESSASLSASLANAAANAAVLASGAVAWVSGTSYTIGQQVWSPTTFQNFRRRTNGAGTTDPSSDATNWEPLSISSTNGITLNNTVTYKGRLSGGTPTNLLSVSSSDFTDLEGNAGVRTYVNGLLVSTHTAAGNLGIGTNTPGAPLDVFKSGVSSIKISSNLSSNETVLSLDSGNIGLGVRDSQIASTNDGSNRTSLHFRTSNSSTPVTHMRINHLGNLGVGVLPGTSTTRLTVQQSTSSSTADETVMFRNSAVDGPFIRFGVAASAGAWNPLTVTGDQYIAFGTGTGPGSSSNSLSIIPWASTASGIRINNLGFLCIGTSLPLAPLHISNATPAILLTESDQSASNTTWRMASNSSTFNLDVANDSASSFQNAIAITRSGVTVTSQAFSTGGTVRINIDSSGVVTYGGIEVGYRNIPRVTGGLEAGKCLATAAGVTLNTGQVAGTTFSVYNDSASAITLTQGSGLTLRLAGSTSTGNRTVSARGMATIWYNSTTEAVVTGAGVF